MITALSFVVIYIYIYICTLYFSYAYNIHFTIVFIISTILVSSLNFPCTFSLSYLKNHVLFDSDRNAGERIVSFLEKARTDKKARGKHIKNHQGVRHGRLLGRTAES